MPQSLAEAMSLGKVVISSSTLGGKEIIKDKENGLLFDIGNERQLAEKLLYCLDKNHGKEIQKLRKYAQYSAKGLRWSILVKKLQSLLL